MTLVEVVVAATLMAVVLTGSLLVYERALRDWVWTDQYADVLDNLQIGVDRIVGEARKAASVTVEGEGRTLALTKGGDTIKYTYDAVHRELERESQPVTTRVITAVNFSADVAYPTLVTIELSGRGPRTREVSVRTKVYAGAR
jgi:hypothetical protein